MDKQTPLPVAQVLYNKDKPTGEAFVATLPRKGCYVEGLPYLWYDENYGFEVKILTPSDMMGPQNNLW